VYETLFSEIAMLLEKIGPAFRLSDERAAWAAPGVLAVEDELIVGI
jgi:hypothetical protein